MVSAHRSTADPDLDELRARRTRLVDQLHDVQYRRHVARAQSDLLIASLLYAGQSDLDGLHGLALPPAAPGRRPGAGERLELLRERAQRMREQERAVRDELDTVTGELVERVLPRQAGERRPAVVTRGTL